MENPREFPEHLRIIQDPESAAAKEDSKKPAWNFSPRLKRRDDIERHEMSDKQAELQVKPHP